MAAITSATTTTSPLNTTTDIIDLIVSSPLDTPIHIAALFSGGISIIFSICTLVILSKDAEGHKFYRRKQGERLVAYLAVCDLLFGTEHMTNHILNMVYRGRPPPPTCFISGFCLQVFVWTQAIVVVICALSAFLLVARGIRPRFGKRDYRLLLFTLIIPIGLASVFAVLEYLGPSGHWCHADTKKPEAMIVYVVNGIMMITVSIICAVLYTGVWIQISRVNRLLKATRGQDDPKRRLEGRHRTAKILVCFVVAYFVQWWPLVMYGVWSFIGPSPPEVTLILIVLFCNLGGVFNFFAYTFIRRIQKRSRLSSLSSSASTQSKFKPLSAPLARSATLPTELNKTNGKFRPSYLEGEF